MGEHGIRSPGGHGALATCSRSSEHGEYKRDGVWFYVSKSKVQLSGWFLHKNGKGKVALGTRHFTKARNKSPREMTVPSDAIMSAGRRLHYPATQPSQ